MYVCVCLCAYGYYYICVCICMCMCMYVCVCVCMCACGEGGLTFALNGGEGGNMMHLMVVLFPSLTIREETSGFRLTDLVGIAATAPGRIEGDRGG